MPINLTPEDAAEAVEVVDMAEVVELVGDPPEPMNQINQTMKNAVDVVKHMEAIVQQSSILAESVAEKDILPKCAGETRRKQK